MKPSRFWLPTGVGGMPVLRRKKSAIGPALADLHAGQIGGMYCTRSSRSLRGLGATGIPALLRTAARVGLRTKFANCESLSGNDMLKRSFEPVPIINSLISELPSRFTC